MKVYDEFGRLAVSTVELTPADGQFIRKNDSDVISGGLYTFSHVGASIRFKNGRLQRFNVTDSLWYYEICSSVNGVPSVAISDEPGEAS